MSQPSQSPLTADQSRAARRELALSQKDVIAQTGIAAYKLKQFESGSFRPDMATLKVLREFYEGQGVNFAELDAYLRGAREDASGDQETDDGPAGGRKPAAIKPGMTPEPRPGFFISADLPGAVVDKLQTDMEDSDDRIAEIVKSGLKKGIFGDLSGETEGLVQELFAHLAVNYLRFRCLQGRNIIEATRDEAKTVGDYLAQWVLGQGVALVEDHAPDVPQPRSAVGTRARVEAVEQE